MARAAPGGSVIHLTGHGAKSSSGNSAVAVPTGATSLSLRDDSGDCDEFQKPRDTKYPGTTSVAATTTDAANLRRRRRIDRLAPAIPRLPVIRSPERNRLRSCAI